MRPAAEQSDTAVQPLRVVLEIAPGGTGEALHGTAQLAGSTAPQPFWGALDLLRLLESVAQDLPPSAP